MNDLEKLKRIQKWKKSTKVDKRDNKTEVLYLKLRECTLRIKHNKRTKTFIITSDRHSFEVDYYTRFRSYHIRNNVEKNVDLTLRRIRSSDKINELHEGRFRRKLIDFLINQF